MNTHDFTIRGECIALCDLLKATGVAESGGMAKVLITSGAVLVDGQPELRKTAKIRAGQVVSHADRIIHVKAASEERAGRESDAGTVGE